MLEQEQEGSEPYSMSPKTISTLPSTSGCTTRLEFDMKDAGKLEVEAPAIEYANVDKMKSTVAELGIGGITFGEGKYWSVVYTFKKKKLCKLAADQRKVNMLLHQNTHTSVHFA